LVLVIGDFHVPHRSPSLPPKFKQMLVWGLLSISLSLSSSQLSLSLLQVPGKIQHVICTGNLCTREMLDYLKTLAPDVHVVQGDFDELVLCFFLSNVTHSLIYRLFILSSQQIWYLFRALSLKKKLSKSVHLKSELSMAIRFRHFLSLISQFFLP
jgi:predicted phosphodiesterase